MRIGAERVAAWLTTNWRKRKLPDVMPWLACARALALEKGAQDSDVPLDGYGPVPLACGSKVVISSFPLFTSGFLRPPLSPRCRCRAFNHNPIARARDAICPYALVCLSCCNLHVQASIFKAADRIDVADLPQGLPRREVQGFTWTDNSFEICITCPLPEPVAREQVLHFAHYLHTCTMHTICMHNTCVITFDTMSSQHSTDLLWGYEGLCNPALCRSFDSSHVDVIAICMTGLLSLL